MNIMDTLKKPVVMAVIALLVGVFLGLTWGWVVQPVQYVNTEIKSLRYDLQRDYLRMAIESYQVNRDVDTAIARYDQIGGENALKALGEIQADPQAINPKILASFTNALANRLENPTPASGGADPNAGGNPLVTIGIIVVALILIGAVAIFIVIPLFRSNKRAPEDMTPAMLAAEHSRTMEKTDYSTVSATPPVAQYVTTYVLGDDLFDDSFSIDAPSGEFLGECGVGISETVGVGDPKKVTAFEVWMFDKNDIQTITKVLMSSNAFSDMALRARLEPKGELVQVDPRKQIVLETQTLQMIATISDMQYGQGALPNGSYFDRVTMELAIWQKAK